MKELSPIIVFAYNRPKHLHKTLEALSNNILAADSEVYIFIDGVKDESGIRLQKEVVEAANGFKCGHFKNVYIYVSEVNKGLSTSIISGVDKIIKKNGKVIVVEDDSVSSPYFLEFMNKSLDLFKDDKRVWSIGGYTVPMKIPALYSSDIIISQRVSSYAWATWKDRWERIDWQVSDYNKFRFNLCQRKKFNKWGEDRSLMLDDQMLGRVNSWAIRFDYAMYKNGMFNIIPIHSLICNTGYDGSGTHNGAFTSGRNPFSVKLEDAQKISNYEYIGAKEDIRIEFCKPFKISGKDKIKRFIGNIYKAGKRKNVAKRTN